MRIHFLAALLLAALVGCRASDPRPIAVPFDQAKAQALLKAGNNQVTGRIMVALASGTLMTCANSSVSLVPATDYAKEWVRKLYELDSGRYGTVDSAYRMDARETPVTFPGAETFYATTRTARCDEDGDFAFLNVADGEFFVVARTRWLGKDHDYFDFMYGSNDAQEEDGSVMLRVRLSGGQTVNLEWAPPPPRMLGGQGLP